MKNPVRPMVWQERELCKLCGETLERTLDNEKFCSHCGYIFSKPAKPVKNKPKSLGMAKKIDTLYGCGAKNGEEVDGQEFEVTSLKGLVEVFKQYPEVHLNYFDGEEDLDLWIRRQK